MGKAILLLSCAVWAGILHAQPSILTLKSNVKNVHPAVNLKISAIVTHPSGIDQLIGGLLLDENGNAYGPLISPDREGSYGISLSWQEINQMTPVTAPVEGTSRKFIAEFYDQAGNVSQKAITLLLGAHDGVNSFCSGEKDDLNSSERNCGQCGRDFQSYWRSLPMAPDLEWRHVLGPSLACMDGRFGQIPIAKDGLERDQPETPESCDSICARKSLSCEMSAAPGSWRYSWGNLEFRNSDCSALPAPILQGKPLTSIHCACREGK